MATAVKRLEVADLKAPGMMIDGAQTYSAACSSPSVRVAVMVGVIVSEGHCQT